MLNKKQIFHGSNQIIYVFFGNSTSTLIVPVIFLENVEKQGNIYLRIGNKGTREPGTKKRNIKGIPVFLEKQGNFPLILGNPVPGEYATKLMDAQSINWIL